MFIFGQGVIEATEDQFKLLQITEVDAVRYLNKQAYGAEEPEEGIDPVHIHGTLKQTRRRKPVPSLPEHRLSDVCHFVKSRSYPQKKKARKSQQQTHARRTVGRVPCSASRKS